VIDDGTVAPTTVLDDAATPPGGSIAATHAATINAAGSDEATRSC
jgi:hypothetical protein